MTPIILKWGSILFLLLALAFLACWVSSFSWPTGGPQLAFGGPERRVEMLTTKGGLILCDAVANLEVFEVVDRGRLIGPAVAKDGGWRIPGCSYRHIAFGGGSSIWAFQLSLLVPLLITALLAGYCIGRLKVFKRRYSLRETT